MKIAWRQLLEHWKKTDGRGATCVPKSCFPRLFKVLIDKFQSNAENNIRAGFRKTGISPLDMNKVLARLPNEEKFTDLDKTTINDKLQLKKYALKLQI